MYIAGHSLFVGWAPESGSITESETSTAATFPAAPGSYTLLGYMDVPERRRGFNNGWGDSIGLGTHAYRKRGAVTPSVSFTLKAGALSFLENINLSGGKLPWFCLWIGVPGVWTERWRFCKLSTLSGSLRESQAEASEIEFQCDVQATGVETLATALDPDTSALRTLGDPLFFNDTRVLTLENAASTPVVYNLRRSLMNLSFKMDWKLERKASRYNWGDHKPLSRTSYDMLEHIPDITGELGLHDRVDPSLVDTLANSLDWGDLVLGITNATATRAVDMTMMDLFPSDIVGAGVPASGQQSYTVPFSARDYSFETTSS